MIIASTQNKQEVLEGVEKHITSMGFTVVKKDFDRPWGGFLVIDEAQAEKFAKEFFPHISFSTIKIGRLSPKILIVEANKRLSWQYHHRRSEIWKAIGGKAGVVTSSTDKEGEVQELNIGDVVQLAQGQRHRLVGLNQWGVLAEIWQHTDPSNPSDEDDIVRVQDDFGR
jgi:mannose-6-phosphate isomerase